MQPNYVLTGVNEDTNINSGLHNIPITSAAVQSIHKTVKSPQEMCLINIIGSLSAAIQRVADVEQLHGGSGPVSVFTFISADSGERKTGTTKKATKPLNDYDRQNYKIFEEELKQYNSHIEIFNNKRKYLKKQHTEALKQGESEAIKEAEQNLLDLEEDKPSKPINNQLIFEDITTEALQLNLKQGNGNAALISSEAGSIFGGHIIRNLPFVCSQWSGEPCAVDRKTSESFQLEETRLTLSASLQPSALEKFMNKKGEEALGIGFLARFIFCSSSTTQGFRFTEQGDSDDESGYLRYCQRMNEILAEYDGHSAKANQKREVIKYKEDARMYALGLSNAIEKELLPGGRFQFAKYHGNKLFENIARIAALLTYFEEGKGAKITLGILQDAERIAFYFSDSYIRHFQVYPEVIKDAATLIDYFKGKREAGMRYIPKNPIIQSGPASLRNRERLDRALEYAANSGDIKVFKVRRTGLTFIDLYPSLDPDYDMWQIFFQKNGFATSYLPSLYCGDVVQLLPSHITTTL